MKIKPLQWEKIPNNHCLYIANVFKSSSYGIVLEKEEEYEYYALYIGELDYSLVDQSGVYSSLDIAKKVAQKHFEKFIRSWIDE